MTLKRNLSLIKQGGKTAREEMRMKPVEETRLKREPHPHLSLHIGLK